MDCSLISQLLKNFIYHDFFLFPSSYHLYLGTNSISSFSQDVFKNQIQLDLLFSQGCFIMNNDKFILFRIAFDSNKLESLPSGVFDSLTFLQNLFLLFSSLVHFLSFLDSGRKLFDRNPRALFRQIDKVVNPVRLWFLFNLFGNVFYLNDNQISSIPSGLFNYQSKLMVLLYFFFIVSLCFWCRFSMNDNSLESLPSGLFNKMTNLLSLLSLFLFIVFLFSIVETYRATV